MGKHEQKKCLRCGAIFECKVGDIIRCQCYGVVLLPVQQDMISRKYGDCLCRACLEQLKENEGLPEA